jgi:hypothetical protein
MPRFYLHIRNGTGFTRDEEGLDVPSLAAAKQRAAEGARSLLSAEICSGQLDLRGRIEVADEAGDVLLVVPFEEVIQIRTGPLPDEQTRDRE